VLGDPNFVVAEVLSELEMPQISVEHLGRLLVGDLT
jgi:hypothetical protein